MGVIEGLNGLGGGVATGLGLNNVNGPGWLARVGGQLGGYMATSMAGMLPGALGPVMQQFGSMMGDAMTDAFYRPFAKFQLNMHNTMVNMAKVYAEAMMPIDQAASNYAKKMGLMGDQMISFRNQMVKFANDNQIQRNFNKSAEEAIKLQIAFNTEVGKTIAMSDEQQKSFLAIASIWGDDSAVKFIAAFDRLGVSAKGAGDVLHKVYLEANKSGISLEKYSKNVVDHLGMVNKYNFKNGVDGLKSMAELASKIHMDMDMVAQFADKVNTIEGAVDVGAQLQMLGGPFTEFANPMRMLYGSLNDMGDFSERFAEMTSKLGHFDKNQGIFTPGGPLEKRLLMEASRIMGMDYNKVLEQLTTQAKRKEVESQMVGLPNIPEEYKELLMNNATFENGKAGIKGADGKFKTLNQLETNDFKQLVHASKTDSQNIADIAESVRSIKDAEEGATKATNDMNAQMHADRADKYKGMMDALSSSANSLKELVALQVAVKQQENVSNLFSPITSLASTVGSAWLTSKFLKSGGTAARTVSTTAKASSGAIKGLSKIFKIFAEGGELDGGTLIGKQGVEQLIDVRKTKKGMVFNTGQGGEKILGVEASKQYGQIADMLNADKHGNRKYKIVATHSDGGDMEGNPYVDELENSRNLGYAIAGTAALGGYGAYRYATYDARTLSNLQRIASERAATARLAERAFMGGPNSGTAGNELLSKAIKAEQQAQRAASRVANYGDDVAAVVNRAQRIRMASNGMKIAKSSARGMSFAGKALGRAAPLIGGVLDGYSTWLESEESGESVMNRRQAIGKSVGTGIGSAVGGFGGGALMGAALGSVVPGIGNIVGGIIGGILGALGGGSLGKMIGEKMTEANYEKRKRLLREYASEIKDKVGKAKFGFIDKHFDPEEMREIRDALQDGDITEGEIDDYLVQKIQAKGVAYPVLHQGKFQRGGFVTGKPHSDGGTPIIAERGELVATKEWVDQNPESAVKISNGEKIDDIKSVKPIGDVMSVNENKETNSSAGLSQITIEHGKLEIGGTINLNANGQDIDISKILENSDFIANIQRIIINSINQSYDKKGSRFKGTGI